MAIQMKSLAVPSTMMETHLSQVQRITRVEFGNVHNHERCTLSHSFKLELAFFVMHLQCYLKFVPADDKKGGKKSNKQKLAHFRMILR
mmetsp:Transcript_31062/g.41050  ORF Transcript_31062/g.41050 Transcript_31062/m.41050 type:complete len:88 (+) Transcript_31062:1436-1699(+)